MQDTTCWVTGAGGLIGSALMGSGMRPAGWRVVGLSRAELELTDRSAVERRFAAEQPGVLIHCAAMSRSPQCQAEPERAWHWNVDVTGHLAGLFAGRRMVFLSTDLVFDGKAGGYREDAVVSPLSVYGETKVAAEGLVLRDPGHLVVRTSLNHGASPTGDRGFNEEMERAWRAGKRLKLFVDEFRSPIGAEVTAGAVWGLARLGVGGILHVGGGERLSRWEIGQCLAEGRGEAECPMDPGSLKEYAGPPRAPDTSLDSGRAEGLLGYRIPGYREWLRGNRGGGVLA